MTPSVKKLTEDEAARAEASQKVLPLLPNVNILDDCDLELLGALLNNLSTRESFLGRKIFLTFGALDCYFLTPIQHSC